MGSLNSLFAKEDVVETGEVTEFSGGNSYSVLISGITYSVLSSTRLSVGDLVLVTKQKNKKYVLNSITSFSKKREVKVVHKNG